MNVAFSNRPQKVWKRMEMVENPESHCMKFLRSMEDKHTSKFPDPEEIRALTRNMKRENWEVPDNVNPRNREAVIWAYLKHWKSLHASELARFGISPSFMGYFACKNPNVRIEKLKTDNGHCNFYSITQ